MKPLDVYRFGVRLANVGRSEAERRAAVGRLYYGLHHEACRRYFRENPGGLPLGRGSRHVQLIARYTALSIVPARRIQRLLRQLSRMRNKSDYELASPMRYQRRTYSAAQLMRAAVVVAEDLLAELEVYSPGEASDGCHCPVRQPQGFSASH